MILETLRQEVLAVDPAADVPTSAQLDPMRGVSRLDDAQAQWALDRLKTACDKVNIPFPKGLLIQPNGPIPGFAPPTQVPPPRP